MAIITRASKGSELSHAEMDTNFTDLRDGVNLMVPKTQNYGIKTDSLGTPSYGWRDLLGTLYVPDYSIPTAPTIVSYIGGIKQHKFEVNDEAQIVFHLPHDYVVGTDLFIHCHWSHNSTLVTGGNISWGWELTHASGHNTGAFSTPITVTGYQNVSTIQYQHMVAEEIISTPGGSGSLLNTNNITVDGLMFGRVFLSACNITVSSGPPVFPFLHEVDIHYQSTNVGTKQKAPPFWT